MENGIDMIQENREDLDIDYEAKLAEINKALEENALKMAEVEKALREIDERKIFTLKELKEMRMRKEREERERLENEKREIDTITASALKEAESLRDGAKNDDERLMAEYKATDIELKAILHDLEIRKMILHESESKLEDVLAEWAIEENLYQKNKKASMKASKKDGDYYKLREEIYKIKSKKSSYLDKYKEISKVIEKQTCKIADANKILKNINQKLNFNY